VINLTPSKKEVFAEIKRILKPGGELYFADMYSSCRVNPNLKNDPTLWGEGLSGSLYTEDFRRMMAGLGFRDCRVVSKSNVTINSAEVLKKVAGAHFYSITHRCFKIDDLEDRCEDYGEKAKYLGGIPE
jgi:SAM-dependent methyltransferase